MNVEINEITILEEGRSNYMQMQSRLFLGNISKIINGMH
jgi:hypothetical protein